MPKNDKNLEWIVDNIDLSSVSLQDLENGNIDVNSVEQPQVQWNEVEVTETPAVIDNIPENVIDTLEEASVSTIDETMFLDSWDNTQKKNTTVDEWENFWKYIRQFFLSTVLLLIWIVAIAIIFLLDGYISKASKSNPNEEEQKYINQYKPIMTKVKNLLWMGWWNYELPTIWSEQASQSINAIINATDIDYIEKKDLLTSYASDIVNKSQERASYVETLKQDSARQWFIPEEIDQILANDKAIDTIQRSLNALEVIKFSTATRVFSYMNTALTTIIEMMKVWWANIDNLKQLFIQLSSRWEKDISSYVYMCYLNPFETTANCDTVWDLDLYYSNNNDKSIDIKLFKNSMNAISQLLEKNDTSLFSITFNWFDAKDKNITFDVEVYTNQDDERALISQGKKNPNIFILTNIINLLKQSSFIIWADINTKEIHVEPKTINLGWFQRMVNYSTMKFTVPIQKNTEREIFDYIDLNSVEKLLSNLYWTQDNVDESIELEKIQQVEEPIFDNEEYLNDITEEILEENEAIEPEYSDEEELENANSNGSDLQEIENDTM